MKKLIKSSEDLKDNIINGIEDTVYLSENLNQPQVDYLFKSIGFERMINPSNPLDEEKVYCGRIEDENIEIRLCDNLITEKTFIKDLKITYNVDIEKHRINDKPSYFHYNEDGILLTISWDVDGIERREKPNEPNYIYYEVESDGKRYAHEINYNEENINTDFNIYYISQNSKLIKCIGIFINDKDLIIDYPVDVLSEIIPDFKERLKGKYIKEMELFLTETEKNLIKMIYI